MARKPTWTLEKIREWASYNFKGYEIVDIINKEVGRNSRNTRFVVVRCPKYPIHDQYETQLTNFLNLKGCKECSEWDFGSLKQIAGSRGFKLLDVYIKEAGRKRNRAKYVLLRCENNHDPFETTAQILIRGQYQCDQCKLNNWDLESVRRWLLENNSEYEVTDVYYRKLGGQRYRTVDLKCSNEDHPEFSVDLKHFVKNNARCRLCASTQSSGEVAIESFLVSNNIKYQKEFTFDDCYYKYRLRFDFAIFYDNNIFVLIEFDGQQHFYPVTFGGVSNEQANEMYEETKVRDSIKSEYCILNNIRLLRIPYYEFDNIESILLRELGAIIK